MTEIWPGQLVTPLGAPGPNPPPGYDLVPLTGSDPKKEADAEKARLELIEKRRALGLNDDGTPIAATAASVVSGPEFLKTLPDKDARMARAIAEGRVDLPKGRQASDPNWMRWTEQAMQYDPDLDQSNVTSRRSTRRDFTSGSNAKNITAINTALGHLESLAKDADALDNFGDLGPMTGTANRIRYKILEESGDPRTSKFKQSRDAVANELMRVFRQVGASTTEIKEWQDNISASQSPDQFKASIQTAAELLGSRLSAMNDSYQRGMGSSSDVFELLSPHAREIFSRYGIGPGNPEGGDGGDDKAGAGAGPGGAPNEALPPGDGPKVGETWTAPDGTVWKHIDDHTDQNMTTGETALSVDVSGGFTPAEQSEIDAAKQGTDTAGAAVTGAADTITMGALDKLGAGVEAFGDAMTGKGSFTDRFGRRLAVDNAKLAAISDEHPWAYATGQVAGGLVLPTFAARTPAHLAKLGTAYGAAYGAGSSDRLTDVPANLVTGAAVGAASGWAGGKLAEKLEARAAAKTAALGTDKAETSATRYGRGQQFGIDLSLGDAAGMSAKVGERILDVQPGSAGMMNKARQRLGEQIGGAAEDVAATYGPSTSFDGMGRAAQTGLRKWQDKFERIAGKAYGAIPISEKATAGLDNTRQALSELTTVFESNPKMAELFKNTRLNRYMDALTTKLETIDEIGPRAGLNRALGNEKTREAGGGLSWKDLKEFRSRIGEEIGDQRFSESPTKTELRRLYGALSEDMRATANAQSPKALAAFERANSLYRAGQQRIDDAVKFLVGDDGAMSAEKAAARIQAMVKSGKASSDLSKLAEIRKSLPPSEASELINGVIKLLGQPANSAGRDFQAQTFIRNFRDMAPEAKNLLFGGAGKELRQNLDEFSKVMGDVAASDATRNTSNTAMGLAGAVGYGLGGWLGIIGQAAGSYGLAHLWTSPKFVRWATGYSKMARAAAKAAKVEPDKVRTQARLLDKLAASDPSLAQDVLPVRDAILKAVNDNASRSAAASAGDDQDGGQ